MSFQSAQKRSFSGSDKQSFSRPNEPDQIPISDHSANVDPKRTESRPSMICPICEKCFLNRSNLKRHIKNFHPTSDVKNLVSRPAKESLQYKCDECKRQFSLEKNLRYHKRKQHFANILTDRFVLCPVCREEKQEYLMAEHYAECHNILILTTETTFLSFEEFSAWKLNMEKETTSSYVRTGEHKNIDGTVKRYYRCHRSGNFSSKGRGIRRLKSGGSCKIDANCPAFLTLIITNCGQCKVEFQGTHAGHKNDIGHITLSTGKQTSLALKIAAKIPFDPILDEVRDSITDSKLGYDYSRSGNPTRQCLEECIAALECAKYALTFASGLASTVSLTHMLNAGDHIIAFDDLYGGTNRYFRTCATKMGIEISFVDMREIDNVRRAIQKNTKMIWIETPTNPTMKLVDIQGVCELVKSYPGIIVIVDNTFMSAYFQKPLTLGAHVVMHSLTKYMNGHSDVVMGAMATNDEEIYKKMKYLQNSLGTVPSPFDCYLVNRGLKTLHIRMEKHMENGLAVAKFLENHHAVDKVIYPGLPSHPQYELAQRQCSGSSGMVTMYIKGGLKEAQKFIKSLKLFMLGESLGSIESLVEIPSIMTHASVPLDQREKLGISDNLIRLSVGIESAKDLIQDLDQALQSAQQK